jgi:hypothetical protein
MRTNKINARFCDHHAIRIFRHCLALSSTMCAFLYKQCVLQETLQREKQQGLTSAQWGCQTSTHKHTRRWGKWHDIVLSLRVSSRKLEATLTMNGMAPVCINHCVCTGIPAGKRCSMKLLHVTTKCHQSKQCYTQQIANYNTIVSLLSLKWDFP